MKTNNIKRIRTRITNIRRSFDEIVQYWNYELNEGDIRDYQPGSTKYFHWIHKSICGCLHKWTTSISNMTAHRKTNAIGCSICAGKTKTHCCSNMNGSLLSNSFFNSIKSQWSDKNLTKPEFHLVNGHNTIIWTHTSECGCNHEWKSKIASRIRQKSGCPICSGRNGSTPCCSKFKNALVAHPFFQKIQLEWSIKNTTQPSNYYVSSHANIIWTHISPYCGHTHEWTVSIDSRIRQQSGCPHCAKHFNGIMKCCEKGTVIKDIELMKTWDNENNNAACIYSNQFTCGSNQIVHWKCLQTCKDQPDCKHEWLSTICNRKRRGCPYCKHGSHNQRPCCKNKSFASWDKSEKLLCYCSDNLFKPEDILINSHRKVKFNCYNCNRIFVRRLEQVTEHNAWCPRCSPNGISKIACSYFDEYENYYGVKVQHIHFDSFGFANGDEHVVIIGKKKYRIDGFIPETKTAIEFHGDYWHGNPQIFKENDLFSKRRNITYGDQYRRTIKKMEILSKSVNLKFVWEKSFKEWSKDKSQSFPIEDFC